ncbi:PKD domain-containing protein [Actinotalea sp. K2]|uniref:PKD domain-containing protein n=1 Tax=Actinotalea sp. K2 TaxID=2939438 RepID=UPI002017F50C|nr:PKD domain-containing protein [Actinotalea sp. K2]MCL3861290.1 PKD domain-containing protein [Actinotalea sp. K2]
MARTPVRRRIAAFIAVATALATVVVATPAMADTAPADPTLPETVTADGLPTVQIDGVVWDQEIVGNTVYVAGSFSTARPAGALPGVNTVPRAHMLAFDLQTGALISSFAPTFNAQVMSVSASPDGSRLYVGGDFTTVNGATQYRVAALNPTTGAVLPNFRPAVNFKVGAVEAVGSVVYVGGSFSAVGSSERLGLAALNAANGALLPWAPRAENGRVAAIAVSPDATKVVVAGSFTTLNGSDRPGYGMGMVDAVTGESLPFAANDLIRNGGPSSSFTTLAGDETGVYGGGYHFGPGGNLEGIFKASWDGEIEYVQDCHGDTYSVYPMGDVVYSATHHHYCDNVDGGFPQTSPWTFHHGNAYTNYATTPLKHDKDGYFDWFGTPGPTMLYFYPAFTPGSYTGKTQGPWSVISQGDYLVFGGEFTHVNGVRQQGIVRMTTKENAPNAQGPRLAGAAFNPRVNSFAEGTARISWPGNWDRDNMTLRYRLYRESTALPPIYDETVTAPFWDLPVMGFTDTGLTPGSTQRYRVTATDPFNNLAQSEWVTVTIAEDGTLSDYAEGVLDDGASSYWRLGEPSGPLFDWAGFHDATPGDGVTRGVSGAIIGDADAAAGFSGSSSGTASTQTAVQGPNTFSIETWVRTTTNRGGKLVGFGNSATGNSSGYDRHVYMDNAGRIWFGVHPGGVRTVNSTASFNDGQWHHVVASLGPNGMRLYVDGKRVGQRTDVTAGQDFSGYWRLGGDNLNGWTNRPTSNYLAGSLDDVAIYPSVLTHEQVLQHYTDSGRTSSVPPVPGDAYGAAVRGADPDLYWRLGESGGTTASDTSLNDSTGTYRNGVTLGAPGALPDVADTAATFNGNGAMLSSDQQFTNPTTYSQELWFQTTTTAGGKLIGFGSSRTGLSNNYDRHVYMEDSGQLTFGVWTGEASTITSPESYNDGQWHHMVATQSSAGMRLYVDGALVGQHGQTAAQAYNGYWKVGSDTTWGPQPHFAGTIDEVAVYSRALSSAVVAEHYSLGTTGAPPNQVPVAVFSSSVSDLAVSVDGSGSSDPDGTVAGYAWDFGDGATGEGVTASHTYGAAGTYTVTLTVTDNQGATGTVAAEVTVTDPPANQVPVAVFSSSVSDLAVSVDGSGSSDPDGTIAGYAWDFGDGATGEGVSASHTYGAAGTYTVTLTVTDNQGATGTVAAEVTVTDPPANQVPVAVFSSSVSDLAVSVDGSGSSDPDGTVAGYAWDFGDGATGEGVTASHTYGAAGTYTVTLTVTDNQGATGTVAAEVTVVEPGPGTELARDGFGRVVVGDWGTADVGGAWQRSAGSAANYAVSGGRATHRMNASGATVSSYLGAVSSTDTEVQVKVSLDKVQTGGGTYVSVIGRRVDTSEYTGRLRFLSTGAVTLAAMQNGVTLGAVVLPDVDFATSDQLQVRLQVTGTSPTTVQAKAWEVGAAEPATWQVSATNSFAALQAPGAIGLSSYLSASSTNAPMTSAFDDLIAYPTSATPPPANQVPVAVFSSSVSDLAVSVDGSGSSDPDGTVAGYAWDFGDGATGAGVTASHTYATSGTYTVRLTVTDNAGATGTTTRQVSVAGPPPANQVPVAVFSSSVSDLAVSVDGSGSSDPDGTVAGYAWDFGDGATGAGVTASHTYAAAGTYTVTLTVTDNQGATGTVAAEVTVVEPGPVTELARDGFGRVVVGDWGMADVGGAWQRSAGSAANYQVGDGVGSLRLPTPGGTVAAYLNGASSTSVDLAATVSLDKAATGGGTYLALIGRRTTTTDDYHARVRVFESGAVTISAMRSGTTLQSVLVPGLTYAANDELRIRVEVSGTSPTTIRAKVWKVGAEEPAGWQVTTTDATPALQVAGGIGVLTYLTGSTTNAPVTARWDDLIAVPAG